MNKKIKIILGIIIPIIILVLTYAGLVIAKILPNPFLDTSDLVCTREFVHIDHVANQTFIIRFDKWGIVNGITTSEELVFPSASAAQLYFNILQENSVENITLENKKIFLGYSNKGLTKNDLIRKDEVWKKYEKANFNCN